MCIFGACGRGRKGRRVAFDLGKFQDEKVIRRFLSDHVVKNLKKLGTLTVLDSSQFKHHSNHIKRSYRRNKSETVS